jgi:HEAT repeat protein
MDRVEELIRKLKDRDWWERENAATELGKLKDLRAVEPLISALKDSEWGVREAARVALIKLGKEAVEPLIGESASMLLGH